MIASKLAIGTVQFGMPYGVANSGGQVPVREAERILRRAREAGVDTLQTAVAYGDSERTLGEIGVRDWNVVSKLPEFPRDGRDPYTWARALTETSLSKLGIERLHALMLHRSADLLERDGAALHDSLLALKAEGKIGLIGISIYSPAELTPLVGRFRVELVQAPLNVIDRRLLNSGWLDKLASAGVELHVRSAFLQGLLLMHRQNRPEHFARWSSLFRMWDTWLATTGASAAQACLGFLGDFGGISRIVVGVDSVEQLEQLLASGAPVGARLPDGLESDDELLVNPAQWPPR